MLQKMCRSLESRVPEYLVAIRDRTCDVSSNDRIRLLPKRFDRDPACQPGKFGCRRRQVSDAGVAIRRDVARNDRGDRDWRRPIVPATLELNLRPEDKLPAGPWTHL
jgi:hypothetical protein